MKSGGFWDGLFTFFGITIGAGIFGIPYVISQAGFGLGLVYLLLLGIVMTFISLYTGEVLLRTQQKHQLTGLAALYLGSWAKWLMFSAVTFSIYGALFAYILGAGVAITSLFSISPFLSGLLFFVCFSLLLLGRRHFFAAAEGILNPVKLFILFTLSVVALFHFHPVPLSVHLSAWFAPFGVILFSYIGVSALPEIAFELQNKKSLKKVILFGMLGTFFFYLLYSLGILGITAAPQELTVLSLDGVLGTATPWIAGVFTLLAMGSAYLALGFALKETYYLDLKLSSFASWLVVICVPLLLLFFGVQSFVKVLEISGVLGGGIMLLLLLLIHHTAVGKRTPEFTVSRSVLLKLLIALILITGIVVELISLIF